MIDVTYPEWSKTTPKFNGYYWFTDGYSDKASQGLRLVKLNNGELFFHGSERSMPVTWFKYFWLGPIPEPLEPKEFKTDTKVTTPSLTEGRMTEDKSKTEQNEKLNDIVDALTAIIAAIDRLTEAIQQEGIMIRTRM
jgi:hypothetical protein